ncbi:hypothetical protein TNCV_4424811 [Trichonephila clavipes]|nr:hypothetical protein TNCV_4424811 [Trichonephila clavipes]
MLEKVIENWTSRLDYIRASRGSPMPETIFKMYQGYESWRKNYVASSIYVKSLRIESYVAETSARVLQSICKWQDTVAGDDRIDRSAASVIIMNVLAHRDRKIREDRKTGEETLTDKTQVPLNFTDEIQIRITALE